MGLPALEFTDCLTDSPYFRDNLIQHEKELERTSAQIKGLVKDVKDIINAAQVLSRAQRALAASLENFHFECIGSNRTDDEIVIADSLRQFGNLISSIEDERDRMLEKASDHFIKPLDDFRKKKIGVVKEGKKKFEKQTHKFCQSQERYLNLSTKKQDNILQEADASLEMEQRHFCQASLKYVFLLQEVQECKKYEFVETLLGFMYSWLTFYHQGHEVANDCKPYMTDLQKRIQNTRENFETARDQTKSLMNKMLEIRKSKDPGGLDKNYARQGYLLLMEKKALGNSWVKHYCMYEKVTRKFSMIAYNQISGKITGTDEFILKSCTRRMSDSIEKRFCFDLTSENRPAVVFTLQALSEEDRRLWLDAMDGREPTYGPPGKVPKSEETVLDDAGYNFVQECIAELEARGLEEQGLYRLVGVGSKVTKLIQGGLDRRKIEKLVMSDRCEWETKTITSAVKTYFRNLPEPVMTFRYHEAFIAAAKQETRHQRISDVHTLVHRLPQQNYRILEMLVMHLQRVAAKSDKNKMTVGNIGVCFGPTLLRCEEETVAAIMDIKFCNVVVEILIENADLIFKSDPPQSELPKELPPQMLRNANNVHLNHRAHTSPVKHSVVTNYNDGPMRTSWDNIQPGNNSVGGAAVGVGVVSVVAGVGGGGIGAGGMYHSTATVNSLHSSSHSSSSNQSSDRGTSNSSSSSESVASWSGHHQTPPGLIGHPPQPPPYQPPPEHPLINGRDYGNRARIAAVKGSPGIINSGAKPDFMKRARTLYSCVGEHDGELSFEPNEIIINVRGSCEPGWLEGTLRGKTGLIPENYVEMIPDPIS